MIAGATRGSSFSGLLTYLITASSGKGDRGRILGGSVLSKIPLEIIKVFNALARSRPDIEKPVDHVFVSPAQGEFLDTAAWLQIGGRVAAVRGWDTWVAVLHDDVSVEHVHFEGSRVRASDGSVAVQVLRDHRHLEDLMRELEVEFNLQRLTSPKRGEGPHGRVLVPRREANLENKMRRARKATTKDLLRQAIDQALEEGLQGPAFFSHLEKMGFKGKVFWKARAPAGCCWDCPDGRKFKGSTLGTAYTGPSFFSRIGVENVRKQKPRPIISSQDLRKTRPFPQRRPKLLWIPRYSHQQSGRRIVAELRWERRQTIFAWGCSWFGRLLTWIWGPPEPSPSYGGPWGRAFLEQDLGRSVGIPSGRSPHVPGSSRTETPDREGGGRSRR